MPADPWSGVRPVWYRGEGLAGFPDDNFGDGPMNAFLLPRLFPALRSDVEKPDACLLGIGSLLGMWRELAGSEGARLLVFGSGYQYGQPAPLPPGSRVFCVRGRLSAEVIGAAAEAGVADPAILLPRFAERDREAVPGRVGRFFKWDFGVPPSSLRGPRDVARAVRAAAQRRALAHTARRGEGAAGVAVHASRTGGDLVGLLRRIWACERVETDAFHVAVAADAYGIPWRPLRWEFKWQDHFAMLGIAKRPTADALSDRAATAAAQDTLLQRRDAVAAFVEGGG